MKGVIAGGDAQTVAAGEEILERGGNATDAAIAAVFASFVAESVMTNIGGGGIAIVGDIKERTIAIGYLGAQRQQLQRDLPVHHGFGRLMPKIDGGFSPD